MLSPVPRVVTLVLCTSSGTVLGTLPPFEVEAPWWQDAETPVRGAWGRHGVRLRILRLLSADLPAPPGGAVTYLAEVLGSADAGALQPWDEVLESHPLRLPYGSRATWSPGWWRTPTAGC